MIQERNISFYLSEHWVHVFPLPFWQYRSGGFLSHSATNCQFMIPNYSCHLPSYIFSIHLISSVWHLHYFHQFRLPLPTALLKGIISYERNQLCMNNTLKRDEKQRWNEISHMEYKHKFRFLSFSEVRNIIAIIEYFHSFTLTLDEDSILICKWY
jgi:hypothetical protein